MVITGISIRGICFTNEWGDILRLCGATLDQLGGGVAVLAAERYFGGAVARLDEFVGLKY